MPDSRAAAHTMLGRATEISALLRLLQGAASGHGGALIVVGEPGSGRTTLLRRALTLDGAARAVHLTGTAAESDLPYAGLHQVVQALRGHLPELPAAQRAPLGHLLATCAPRPGDTEPAVRAAVLGLLGGAAARRPLLLAVDDAHLLDPPSADALLFAARRMADEPVAMLLTAGPRRAGTSGVGAGPAATGIPELTLGPLAPADARELLRRSAPHPLHRYVADRLLAVADGNPLALTELPETLTPAQCAGGQPIEEPLVPGARLRASHLPWLDGLPETARAALLVPAAAGDTPVGDVLRALALLGHQADALTPAEEAGVLGTHHGRMAFRDPRLRLVVYHEACAARRRATHQALAEILPGPAAARHLAAATPGPNQAVAKALEAAARSATGPDPDLCAELYEHAAAFTRDDDEAGRLLGLAAAGRQRSGAVEHVPALLARALARARTPALRRELAILQARHRSRTGRPRDAHRLLRDAAEQLTGEQPSRAAELLLEAADSAVHAADSRAAMGSAWQAYRLTRLTGTDLAEAAAVHLAQVLALRGERAQARELLLTRGAGEAVGALVGRAEVLSRLEEYEGAFALLDRVLEGPGEPLRQAAALGCRAWLRLWTGDWTGARTDAMEAVECAERRREPAALAQGLVVVGSIEAARGRVTQCAAVLARAVGVARAHGLGIVLGQVAVAEGLLALGAGKYEEAVAGYERAGALAGSAGIEDPSVAPWAANLIEAYIRSGRLAEARREHARFDAEMRRSGPSWALAAGVRCRALLLEADGAAAPGAVEAAFHEALERHAHSRVVFEHARTVLCHGQWLRRTGQGPQARAALEEALSVFVRLGAVPWEQAVRSELRAAGGRYARRGGADTLTRGTRLTEQEARIAALVAGGATNKETAAALFLSTKTVEFHLGNVYRKLGVRSRSELARTFSAAADRQILP
ncbi:DNA-binding CsgD family transcriptional regulator [Streptomyces netropsis]|uniref:DNA-binding CsgD family transcriptional regulator n=3 Tax=Streptomyces netropsis TaxID=55404 RepID=A0A7W7PCC3_STRNE|nr:helix-turn-helix transcriptional regulator [Streptomyces netropsis]MBB4885516.1 DNA-binding CsgD family transcriptional regulator [Streptomyces netropsis]